MFRIFSFVICYTGAVVVWLVKGMKATLNSELNERLDNSAKYYRNLLVGLLVFVFFLVLVSKILNRVS